MQWEWQYGTVETKPLDPVSVDKFYESFDGREWHHALVVLPPTQKEQKLLKVRVLPSGRLVHLLLLRFTRQRFPYVCSY